MISFLGFGLIASLILSFCLRVEATVLPRAIGLFKLIRGLRIFTQVFPAMILAGFTLACSIHFGNNAAGSSARFSQAMLKRYKYIMIISLGCVFVLTLSSEVFSFLLERKKASLSNQPKLVNEYIRVGNSLLDDDRPSPAAIYAEQALKLDPSEKNAIDLKNRAEIAISLKETQKSRFLQETDIDPFVFSKKDSLLDRQNLEDVYSLYKKAKECFDKEDWFNAHYYAESAIKIASGKDINLADAKDISASAWNNLTEKHQLVKSDEQDFFNQKYMGYKAMMEEDYLKAYYIFTNLQLTNDTFLRDSDIQFYTEIARQKVNEKAFFIDETFELKSFESANDVSFSLKYSDGSSDVIYFKGVTQVKTSGNTIQYLRDLSIISLDKNGDYYRSMTVPYAKVLVISVKDMNPLVKDRLGIEHKIKFVPYLMLQSIDRVNDGQRQGPVYDYADKNYSDGPDFMLLPISFDDLLLVESISRDPDLTPINTLFSLVSKAPSYGYSTEVYGQVLMNRILYPLYMLIIFLLLSIVGWNNRLNMNQFFKTTWVLLFPIFSVICFFFDKLTMFIFKLVNYALYYAAGNQTSVIWGAAFYIFLFIASSIGFLSRKAEL